MTTYIQDFTNDSFGTSSEQYWGVSLLDSHWFSETITSIKFTLSKDGAGSWTGDVTLYKIASNGTTEVSLVTKSVTADYGVQLAHEWTFTTTMDNDGGYLMIKGLPQSGSEAVQFHTCKDGDQNPASSDIAPGVYKINSASAPNVRTELPKVEIVYGGVTTGGTRLPPPPIVLGGL